MRLTPKISQFLHDVQEEQSAVGLFSSGCREKQFIPVEDGKCTRKFDSIVRLQFKVTDLSRTALNLAFKEHRDLFREKNDDSVFDLQSVLAYDAVVLYMSQLDDHRWLVIKEGLDAVSALRNYDM